MKATKHGGFSNHCSLELAKDEPSLKSGAGILAPQAKHCWAVNDPPAKDRGLRWNTAFDRVSDVKTRRAELFWRDGNESAFAARLRLDARRAWDYLPPTVPGPMADWQGEWILSVCKVQVVRLACSMRISGRVVSETSMECAVGDAARAVCRWMAINERHQGARVRGSVESVSWCALVRSLSADTLGGSCDGGQSFEDLPLSWVWQNESDSEMEQRIDDGCKRALRPFRLVAISAKWACGRGRRAALADKAKHAVALLIAGHSLDEAARASGFKDRGDGRGGRKPAGDALAQALRRLGVGVLGNLRASSSECHTVTRWALHDHPSRRGGNRYSKP